MRLHLFGRTQLGEPSTRSRSERSFDQQVGEMGVLGEERSVQVGAENIAGGDALSLIFAVVTGAAQDAAERTKAGPQIGLATVVLEADQRRRRQPQVAGLHYDVAGVAPCARD